MSALTIGRVAQLASVGVETIRFYEREGLIAIPPRVAFSYRHYPQDTVSRLRFIKRAKALGFSLKEIKELLSLRVSPEVTCEDVRACAEAKIADIEDKIRQLQTMRRALVGLMETCQGSGPVSECPILESLALEETDHGHR
jgi:MerR family copper efflux transcriptional regulator